MISAEKQVKEPYDQRMLNEFSRTELLLGARGMEKLARSRVSIFGIGGVGSYTAEALARSGVGRFVLVDDDRICLTNINRQLHALRSTVGKYKADVMRERILEINPKAQVEVLKTFCTPENVAELIGEGCDYVVDAIDTVSAKLALIVCAKEKGVPVISCMGAGNKLDPTRFEVADIYKTSVCPLAKVMRRELRKRGVASLKVVYSTEPPLAPRETPETSCRFHCICPPGTARKCTVRRAIPGSISFVPSVAGLILAGEVVKDLALDERQTPENPDASAETAAGRTAGEENADRK
jgi:tRNA A37 threonylcarbamoyladenosine dehydratase